MTATAFSNVSADLALAVYLEPHADRRRVLLLGEVEGALAAHLSSVATHLDIIEPSAREPGARPGRALDASADVPELPFDDESFDLVVIADDQALPEPRRAAFRELRRVTARAGLLAVASVPTGKARRGEPSEADALSHALQAEFDHVRMFAQAPLLGYVVSDLEATRGAELSIDSSLVRDQDELPERLLALASDARPRLESRLWVQVPGERSQARPPEVDPRLVESLRKAEDDARRALHRESDLLRELERERKAREVGEAAQERNRALERKLLAIEADYDDAVGRVRYLERLLLEREAETKGEREREEHLQAELRGARADLAEQHERLSAAESERDAARADAEAAAQESPELERRLEEVSNELSAARQEVKRQETIARDLLEELRGLEQRALAAVEHDARVAELEAERERAMQRALEAEVARESAQMRVDELRAQLEPSGDAPVISAEALAELERKLTQAEEELADLRSRRADETSALYVLRGERNGLRMRLAETEQALLGVEADAREDDGALDTRLALAEARAQAAIEALGAAEESLKTLRVSADEQVSRTQPDESRVQELEALLSRAGRRVDTLERELEEADRFAEDHAEDADRIDGLERELMAARQKLDELEDDVRSAQDELFAQKAELQRKDEQVAEAREAAAALERERARLEADANSRVEQLTRLQSELRTELDDGHAALAEARAILSHLAVRVGADTHDLPAIMQALDQQTSPPMLDALRTALAEAQAARSEGEYQLARLGRELVLRDQRIRELEESLHGPASAQPSFEPPEV